MTVAEPAIASLFAIPQYLEPKPNVHQESVGAHLTEMLRAFLFTCNSIATHCIGTMAPSSFPQSSDPSITEPPALVIPSLIVGLGNPGRKYEGTRHNIGFMAIDHLAKAWGISVSQHSKFNGEFGDGRGPKGDRIVLLKPLTYMNRSGQSIRAVVDWFKLSPEQVLIIYDDMDLPVGRLRMRLSGSAGGHNGMKSAIAHLGTQDFPRLRIGIGSPQLKHPESNQGTVSHVLGSFSAAERRTMDEMLNLVLDAVELGIRQGVAKSMSLYNGRSLTPSAE